MLAVSLQCSVQAQGTGSVPEGILTGTSHSISGFSVVKLQPQTLTSSSKTVPPTLRPCPQFSPPTPKASFLQVYVL